MPGRDSDSQERSARVADEIRAAMKRQGLTGAGLRDRLREAGVTVPNDMWITRRMTGQVNLVKPVKVVYGPTDDLVEIAKVLNVDPDRLVKVVNVSKPKRKPAADTAPAGDTPAV